MTEDEKFVRHADDDRVEGEKAFSLARAFSCARDGIVFAFLSQRNLKIHAAAAVFALAMGAVLKISEAGWLAVILCIALVTSLELVNTAIESVVDLASPEWNILAKRAKDCAAGAVYLSAFASVVVAIIVFGPRLASALGLS